MSTSYSLGAVYRSKEMYSYEYGYNNANKAMGRKLRYIYI